MLNAQWKEIPFALETAAGEGADALALNPFLALTNPVTHFSQIGGPQWFLDPAGCLVGAGKRVARDNMPQKPGEVVHRKYRSGLVMQVRLLAVNVTNVTPSTVEFVPACEEDLVTLGDTLMSHLDACENQDGRITWLPSGKLARMMDAARWLGSDPGSGGATSVEVTVDDVVFSAAQVAFLSPFPYAMDAAQTITCLGGETPNCSGSPASVSVDNTGTTAFYPVVRVYGPTGFFDFSRTNAAGETLHLYYSDALPGASTIPAGQFVEFDFFRETAYFNASSTNAKPGIEVEFSDFWTLDRGVNTLFCADAAIDVFWQPAYTG